MSSKQWSSSPYAAGLPAFARTAQTARPQSAGGNGKRSATGTTVNSVTPTRPRTTTTQQKHKTIPLANSPLAPPTTSPHYVSTGSPKPRSFLSHTIVAPIVFSANTASAMRVRPSSAASPQRVRPASASIRSSRSTGGPGGRKSPSPERRGARSPSGGRSSSRLSNVQTQRLEEHLFESAQSRLHGLHFLALKAAWQRRFPELISLRVEMLCFARIIGGRKAPGAVLAELQLADAYLRGGLPRQAISHALPLVPKLEEMQYAQGSFEAHMLLGRAYHAQALELKVENKDPGTQALPAEWVKMLSEKACKHFSSAQTITTKGHETFFLHTTIRAAKDMDAITVRKAMEATLALSHSQAALGQVAQQQETLTGAWEKLDAHLTQEARREEYEAKNPSPTDREKNKSPSKSTENNDPTRFDINQSLHALELYLSLGRSFFLAGDDANAIDNLQRCIGIADKHRTVTFAQALREDLTSKDSSHPDTTDSSDPTPTAAGDSSPSPSHNFPSPSTLQWSYVVTLKESCLLLARALARNEQAQASIAMYEKLKLFQTNLKGFNKILNLYYSSPSRPPLIAGGSVPSHIPTSATEVSHAMLDNAWTAMVAKEWTFVQNLPACYNYEALESDCSKTLLFIEKELALLQVALGQYDQAAVHQEEVCLMLESAAGGGGGGGEFMGENDGPDEPTSGGQPSSAVSSLTGLYQVSVARAHKRLGDIYVASGQPRSARASYTLAKNILETMFLKKIHSQHVPHAKHSGFQGGNLIRPGSGVKKRITTGFGSTLPYGFIRIPDTSKAEERFVPPAILKLLAELKANIRTLERQIKQEDRENNPPSPKQEEEKSSSGSRKKKKSKQREEPPPVAFDFASYAQSSYAAAAEEYGSYGSYGDETEETETAGDGGQATGEANGTGDTEQVPSAYEAESSPVAGTDDTGAAVSSASNEDYGADEFNTSVSASGSNPTSPTASAKQLPQSPHQRSPSGSASIRTPKRYVSFHQSAHSSREGNTVPRNPHLGGGSPSVPHQFDHLVGDSNVFGESLLLRTVGEPQSEAERVRKSAYDAFAAEKADENEPVKASRKLRPQSAVTRTQNGMKHATPAPSVLVEDETVANGASEQQQESSATAAIDFSQFSNLDL